MYKLALSFFMLAVILAAPSFADDDAVTRELDAYARANSLPPENIAPPVKSSSRKTHEFEFGVERYSYLYREGVTNFQPIRFKGFYNGFVFSYTFRPVDVDSLAEILKDMFRIEFRYATGRTDYTGAGTWNGIKDYMYEIRGIVGHELFVSPTLQITPYIGLGYRYLNDGLQAIPARTVDNIPFYSGYNRESRYCYIPVGVELHRQLDRGWGIGWGLEYDLWITGKQTSHFEDMVDAFGGGAGWDPMDNKQKSGFGLRGSLKVDKAFPRMKLGIEPYYRYWKIKDSEVQSLTGPGAPNASSWWEPQNTTQEIGVKVGVKF